MNDTIWEDKSHCSALSSHSSRSSVSAEILNMESWTLATSMLLVIGMSSPSITLKEPTPGSYGGTTEPGGDAVQPKVMGGLHVVDAEAPGLHTANDPGKIENTICPVRGE